MICQRCNEEVPVSPGQKILTCDPVYSPYLKRNQLTTLIKHTHGIGRELRWMYPDLGCLTAEEWERLGEILENPPKAPDWLREAMKKG